MLGCVVVKAEHGWNNSTTESLPTLVEPVDASLFDLGSPAGDFNRAVELGSGGSFEPAANFEFANRFDSARELDLVDNIRSSKNSFL